MRLKSFSMFFFPREVFRLAHCERIYSLFFFFFCNGWQAGAGLELQVQNNKKTSASVSLWHKKAGIKNKKPKQNGTACVLCV